MKINLSIASAMLCCALCANAQMDMSMQIVKHTDHAKRVSYMTLMKDEIVDLKKQITLEAKYISRANGQAKKIWTENKLKGQFPRGLPRKIQVIRKSYKDLSKIMIAAEKLESKVKEKEKAELDAYYAELGTALVGTVAGTPAWYAAYAEFLKEYNKDFIKQLEKEIGWQLFAEQMKILLPVIDEYEDEEPKKEEPPFKLVSEKGPDYPNVQTHYKLLKPVPCPVPGKALGNLTASATITVSSVIDYTLKEGAIDGIVAGGDQALPYSEWAARIPDPNAFLQLAWKKPQRISRILLFDRPNHHINVASGKITFNDGTFITTGVLPLDGRSGLDIRFKPKSVKTIRFDITSRHIVQDQTGIAEIAVYK